MELLNERKQNLETFLEAYKAQENDKYEKPSVTVDTLIFTVRDQKSLNYRKLPEKELYVLMIRRKDHPCIGMWALPGGFINMDEDLNQAALRELKEETNLDEVYLEQLFTFGDTHRDPRTRIISVAYMALVSQEFQGQLRAGDDASEACWFKVNFKLLDQASESYGTDEKIINQKYKLTLTASSNEKLVLESELCIKNMTKDQSLNREVYIMNSNGIAFDHAKIITYGLERIKNKVDYTDIIYSLMPKVFTLSELQQVYELMSGEKQYAAQFRRKVEPKLIKMTEHITEGKGHRPAMHYQYNPLWKLEQSKEVYDL